MNVKARGLFIVPVLAVSYHEIILKSQMIERMDLDVFVFPGLVYRADLGGRHPCRVTENLLGQREKAQRACALPGQSNGGP